MSSEKALDWDKQGPHAVIIKWKDGATDEAKAAAQPFIAELAKSLNQEGVEALPEAIESVTISRS